MYGYSESSNAVVGQTNQDFDAAISGLAKDSNGLAFWGTGGIIVTGSAQKPGGGPWSSYSDARVKKHVKPLNWSLQELRGIRPVEYEYNGLGGTVDDGHMYVGVIAQELEKILPNMVSSRHAKLRESDSAETDIKVVDPNAFTYILINAVKEQQEAIERDERRIAYLEGVRNPPLSASLLSGGVGTGVVIGLLPFAVTLRRRRKDPDDVSQR